MRIDRKLRKRIKTIALMQNKYPEQINVSEEEYAELEEFAKSVSTYSVTKNEKIHKFEGVRLNVK